MEHWDVKTAFLTTKMDCDIDVTLPEAFNSDVALQQNARRGLTRHRVLKVIPGCPQGSRLWHDSLFAFLSKKGFIAAAPQEECLLVDIHLLVWMTSVCLSLAVINHGSEHYSPLCYSNSLMVYTWGSNVTGL